MHFIFNKCPIYGHDCASAKFSTNSHETDYSAAPVRATGTVRKRQAVRPVHNVQNHTCLVTLLQPARRAAVLGQPSRLRSH